MPRDIHAWNDSADFDDDDANDDDANDDDDSENWTVEQWEADLQKQDERDRKMMERLDKHGRDEAGFRKAMEELGLGKIFEELDHRRAERKNQPEAPAEDEEEPVDRILRESRAAAGDDEPHFQLPLAQAAHELTLMVMRSVDGDGEVDSREHPLSLYCGAYLDAQGGLAGMGYMREWDDEFDLDFEPPKNQKIAELKRVVKNYVKGLLHLEQVEQQNLLAPERCEPIRQHTVELLDEVRQELRRLGWG